MALRLPRLLLLLLPNLLRQALLVLVVLALLLLRLPLTWLLPVKLALRWHRALCRVALKLLRLLARRGLFRALLVLPLPVVPRCL